MDNVKIYHSYELHEYITKKTYKEKGEILYFKKIPRVTLCYMVINDTIYIAAARCSTKDQFSKKKGVSIAMGRLNAGFYAAILKFNSGLNKYQEVDRDILKSICASIARKRIRVK